MAPETNASFSSFTALDIRVGTIIQAVPSSNTIKPAYILDIDFGPLGVKRSSAQITDLYSPELLTHRQVIAVVNFPPKQIARILSECLVLGVIGLSEGVVLLTTEKPVPNGSRIA